MLGEIDRLNRLTEEFLGLAREMPLAVEDVELAALVATITQDAQVAVPAARIECIARDGELRARIDPARLKQALLNLVLNAAQVGGSGVHVRVEVSRVRDHARLSVVDDGPGVPAAIAATLFEPFVGSRPGGSGLGLAVARRVAERHGGTLLLESTPGAKGARFTLSLPLG
jgi:signal transduction histidine kinase